MRTKPQLALLAAVALLFCCGRQNSPLNVIMIGIDTLRPDHLGCYGYGRNTSPNIDRLASRGALFEHAISQAPWTLPSFATVFTSLYPCQHGGTSLDTRMRTSFPTLASILRDQGYSVAAIVNAPLLRPEFGLNRGFEHYDVMPPHVERRADEVTEEALKWLDRQGRRPFFLFAHYFDPHLSYSPPPPYDALFDPEYRGPMGSSFDLDYFSSQEPSVVQAELSSLSAAESSHLVSLYDGEIAFTDSAIGTLLDGLEEHGLQDHTLIVLLSDHGEEFLDHGGLDHGHSLYNELIWVPLIFSLPGVISSGRITHHVRLLDLAPTILDILGVHPQTHFEGCSHKTLLVDREIANPEASQLLPPGICYSEALRRNMTTKSVIAYPWKLIYDTKTHQRTLFDLSQDPGETQNLQDQRPKDLLAAEDLLFRAMTGLSNTWYVRMAGGPETHSFSLTITPQAGPGPGSIQMCRLIDEHGHYVHVETNPNIEVDGSRLAIRELRLKGQLTLTFETDRKQVPLEFDLMIDGLPATQQTYLGQSLTPPGQMPFTRRAGRQVVRSDKAPSRVPPTPYFLIWHSEMPYEGDNTIRLEKSTKRELRALGYIQ